MKMVKQAMRIGVLWGIWSITATIALAQGRAHEKANSPDEHLVSLYINEFLASNDSIIADEAGEYDDWIELYNGGSDSIWLGDKFLTDDPMNPGRWAFPDTSIAGGQYLLIWADDDEEQGPLHTNFKLERNGEFIGIYDSLESGFSVIDSLSFGLQATDTSLGRLPDGTGDFQQLNPTPGTANESLVSIEGLDLATVALELYPNPFSEELRIRWDHIPAANMHLRMTDVQGRVLWERAVGPGETAFSWKPQALSEGVYTVSLMSGQQLLFAKKVIFQK